jgi:hypothetical protein
MYGWISEIIESLVLEKFGADAWDKIKIKAGCTVPTNGFLRHGKYEDSETIGLVSASADVLGISVDAVLEVFGHYFITYVDKEGFDDLLRAQGSSLREMLANLNSLHMHLERSLASHFLRPDFVSRYIYYFSYTCMLNYTFPLNIIHLFVIIDMYG